MKNYVKPIVLMNEELAEGVYAASGDIADCWTVEAVSTQDWNGWSHEFEIRCRHSTEVEHISSASTVTLTFSAPVKDASSQFTTSHSGKTVTVTRDVMADAYKSGDLMTYKVWVIASDEATTRAITCTNASISCTKAANVQGGMD